MEEKFIEEKKHKDFIEEEDFGANIFPKESRLLKIIIAPLSFSKEPIIFSEMKDWLKKNYYPEGEYAWSPFLNGVRTIGRVEDIEESEGKRTIKETPIFVALLFRNKAVSYCDRFAHPEGKSIPLQSIASEVCSALKFTGMFYGKIKFSDPVRVYLQLTNAKSLPIEKDESSPWSALRWLSPSFEKKWLKENLVFYEDSSGKEITENYQNVAKRVSDRLAQAFGLWESPYQS